MGRQLDRNSVFFTIHACSVGGWRRWRNDQRGATTLTVFIKLFAIDTTTLQTGAIHVVAPVADSRIPTGIALPLFYGLALGLGWLPLLCPLFLLLFPPTFKKSLVAGNTPIRLVDGIGADAFKRNHGLTIGTLGSPIIDTGASKVKDLLLL